MDKKKGPFDPITKIFYTGLFESYGVLVDAGKEVFSNTRSIDLVVKCDNKQQLQNTVFKHFLTYNAIELKGGSDPITLLDYNIIMMRVWGLGAVKIKKKKDEEILDREK